MLGMVYRLIAPTNKLLNTRLHILVPIQLLVLAGTLVHFSRRHILVPIQFLVLAIIGEVRVADSLLILAPFQFWFWFDSKSRMERWLWLSQFCTQFQISIPSRFRPSAIKDLDSGFRFCSILRFSSGRFCFNSASESLQNQISNRLWIDSESPTLTSPNHHPLLPKKHPCPHCRLSLYSVWLFNHHATYLCHNLTSVFTTNVLNQHILLEMSAIQVWNVQPVTYTFHFLSFLPMVPVEFKSVVLTMILDSILEFTINGKIIVIRNCLETRSRISLLEELLQPFSEVILTLL